MEGLSLQESSYTFSCHDLLFIKMNSSPPQGPSSWPPLLLTKVAFSLVSTDAKTIPGTCNREEQVNCTAFATVATLRRPGPEWSSPPAVYQGKAFSF